MEKIFEQPLKKPLVAVRKNIGARIILLNKKYQKLKKEFKVVYAWDKKNDILQISSSQYKISAYIHFTKNKVVGYIDIPFFLKTVAWMYQDKIIKEVKNELDNFLRSIKSKLSKKNK